MSASSFETDSWSWQISQLQAEVSEWVEYQFSRWQPSSGNNSANWSLPPIIENIFKFMFWMLLFLLASWIVWKLWREFSPYLYSQLAKTNSSTITNNVPTQNLSIAQWWERSQQLYSQGNYQDACRCLYLAMLQYLHENQIVPQKYSRTDGEYLQLIELSGIPLQPYETLITTHEQSCFSDRKLNADNYQQCQQAYGEITK